jgi:hypothetical protein
MKKREKSKGNIHIYKFYLKRCKEREVEPLTSSMCRSIWEDCNLMIKDILLLESDEFRLPYRLGGLRVLKLKINYARIPTGKLRIDWGESNKQGVRVYYTQDYRYKVWWDKRTSRVTHIGKYYFKASKMLRRELAQCIKVDKKDYFEFK